MPRYEIQISAPTVVRYSSRSEFEAARAALAKAPHVHARAHENRGKPYEHPLPEVERKLNQFKTARELGRSLQVSKATAQIYINELKAKRKLETALVRQGQRGPLATAYRVVKH